MDLESLVSRVKLRYLQGEHVPGDDEIEEMLRTVVDRITIRMEPPSAADSEVLPS